MKKLLWIGIAAVAIMLSSCEQENSITYSASNDNAYFQSASASYVFGADDLAEYSLTLTRFISGGVASVSVTVSDTSGLFSAPAKVEFADGSTEAKLTVTFDRNQLTTGQQYSLTLKVAEAELPIAERIVECKLNITRDYVWEPYATATFISEMFVDTTLQPIEKVDGLEMYRLTDLYAEGYHFIFMVAMDGSISPVPYNEVDDGGGYMLPRFVTGNVHPSYGMIYMNVDINEDGGGGFYSYFDATGKTMLINAKFYVSAGPFGWKNETLTW